MLATILVHALKDAGASHGSAARALGLTKRTVGAWVRCESPISIETVLAWPTLASAFMARLCDKGLAATLDGAL